MSDGTDFKLTANGTSNASTAVIGRASGYSQFGTCTSAAYACVLPANPIMADSKGSYAIRNDGAFPLFVFAAAGTTAGTGGSINGITYDAATGNVTTGSAVVMPGKVATFFCSAVSVASGNTWWTKEPVPRGVQMTDAVCTVAAGFDAVILCPAQTGAHDMVYGAAVQPGVIYHMIFTGVTGQITRFDCAAGGITSARGFSKDGTAPTMTAGARYVSFTANATAGSGLTVKSLGSTGSWAVEAFVTVSTYVITA